MCYSKEVSLFTSSTIFLTSYWFYIRFLWEKATRSIPHNIRAFSFWIIMSFAAIGGHQLAEFASLAYQSQLIYKLGLVSSILCTYCILRAFEAVSQRRLGSTLVLATIVFISFSIVSTEMIYENKHFWLRGTTHKSWAALWLANWIYAAVMILILAYRANSAKMRTFFWKIALPSINVSFLLSWIYAIIASRYGSMCSLPNCSYHFLNDFIYTYDFPSLWCTFTVIQAPFLYWLLKRAQETDSPEKTFGDWKPSWQTYVFAILVTTVLYAIWYYATPLALGVSWKMMTK